MHDENEASDSRSIAIMIITHEHRVLEAVLQTLLMLLKDIERLRSEPDFPLLAAALCYMEDFHGEHHHPKEDKFLFSALRRRAPGLAPLLNELEAEHARDPAMIGELQRAFVRYQGGTRDGFNAFKATVDVYAAALLEHMRKETRLHEQAHDCLTNDEWREIAGAFQANSDPLAGPAPREEFRRLYQRIVNRLPSKYRIPALRDKRWP
jgi:hemerythrin-like domain-containing protein